MRRTPCARFLPVACGLLLLAGGSPSGREPAPAAKGEKRFPPLQVPAGFKATLFACDPLIEYPSAICPGPRPRSLFVAVDYMTGLGAGIERRDEVRLVEDADGDGHADRATVFASGFGSIQGMEYHGGTLYVMHAPHLTAVRAAKGTGKADERRDLLTGLGLPPEKDQVRLHNANGVVAGHDGWLYLALGDRGGDVKRPEGDRLVLEEGGVLRCRPDGRDAHVFSTGLRNIYDVALDAELNVFVRDNENDGGDYKIRVGHSFFGADHGYPYLYHERPDEALPPLADLGLGSSAGGLCYLDRQFPAEYRGDLFFCEWGRAVVRYRPARAGSSFGPLKEFDFAFGAPADPYGFKPTDLAVDRDGSLFVADWADGQRPRRGRGRIYQIHYVGDKEKKPTSDPVRPGPLAGLDAESYAGRCRAQEAVEGRGAKGLADVVEAVDGKKLGVHGRLHAVWVIAKLGGKGAVDRLFALAKSDPDARVQAQAVRALADLTDPVLVRHRLDAGAGDAAIAGRIAALAAGRDRRVLLEAVIALGRLRWPQTPDWLRRNLGQPDAALAHAAQWALRRSGNASAVLKLLDLPDTEPARAIARRAVADQYDVAVVDGLLARLTKETDPSRRREVADLLARVCKKPAPWTYWGFRPAPRPANSVAWERTEAIGEALDDVLAGADRDVRLDVLRRMLREKVPAKTATLGRWLGQERQADTVATVLAALGDRPASEVRPHLEAVIGDRRHATANRLVAVAHFLRGLGRDGERWLAVAEKVEDGPVLAELLRAAGKGGKSGGAPRLLLGKLASSSAEVRAAAAGAVAELGVSGAGEPVRNLLDDADARVRGAAARAAGRLGVRPASDRLLRLAGDADAGVRRASLDALRRLREPRALPAANTALRDPETSWEALACLGELGGPEHAAAVTDLARDQPSAEILDAAGKVLSGWAAREGLPAPRRHKLERSLATVHGSSGTLLGWYVRGPVPAGEAEGLVEKLVAGRSLPTGKGPAPGWRLLLATGIDARVRFGAGKGADGVWLGHGEVAVPGPERVEFFAAGTGLATVWLNGKVAHRRDRPGVIGPYPDRFEADLSAGTNRVLVRLSGATGPAEFQLRFRRKSAAAGVERLALAALARAGNPERGRQVFLDAEKSLCVKCHRVGDRGERVGPELTGLGGRFSKVHIVESVLEPSRSIAPSYETLFVELKSGRVVSGVKVAEGDESITLVDGQAKKEVVARRDIDEVQKRPVSTMPDGLEKRLTEDEFVDLISYLVSLKAPRGPTGP